MQDESVKIRLEKEAGASSSKTVLNQVGVPNFKSLKVYLWNRYSLSQETNAECFPGFSQLPKPSECIYLVSHIVFWAKVSNDMESKSVLLYMGFVHKPDILLAAFLV